ncbi:hypothetical protein D187_000616 [Cystobacter fuscus DSM 2262]|uniref:Uncharacterized protein n=1 Tax=Cystobacter fuscus (strain ATCC 25194 / DSM 2262 / NBRC 100088 / M29) TaxID=1242864 RepID=S9PQ86_CYSF2|nr:hypothetical protein D187_000616 [Cystobacter fuscus DSM 2262]
MDEPSARAAWPPRGPEVGALEGTEQVGGWRAEITAGTSL